MFINTVHDNNNNNDNTERQNLEQCSLTYTNIYFTKKMLLADYLYSSAWVGLVVKIAAD
jgi:hypothetical protein